MVGEILKINIEQEMRDAYLDYAMSVIIARALPDARDGLKPVHRRILYAMYDMGIRADNSYKKSARIVGEVLGKYHPHGDAAVYESMVRMAQDFSMRYLLVDGQGNFGSIDGDSAAAMRYTEARMTRLTQEMLTDIDKQTVDFSDNFDGSLQEPVVLPANVPNLLINGSTGIAVGMSTNVPPHNLGEVCDALIYMLNQWEKIDDIGVTDLMRFIKGPDFPTGGIVYRHMDGGEDEDTLVSAYATGQGKIIVRGKVHIEDMGRGKSRIIISQLPYQVNKTGLIERIASLVQSDKLEGLADLRDESDRNGMRIMIELQRGVDPTPVLSKLLKQTQLQETYSIRMLALVDNQPRLLPLKQALRVFLDHRLEIIRRRSEYDLARAQDRAHILEGLLKALDRLDEVIQTIRAAPDVETARESLIALLTISEIQAQAILDMQLRRLASLELQKINDEYQEKIQQIAYLEALLADPKQMRAVIADELRAIKSAYSDNRRTVITDSIANTVTDLFTPAKDTWVTLTVTGKLARSTENTAPKVLASVKEPPRFIAASTTAHTLYLITATGQTATIPVQQLTDVDDFTIGTPFNELCLLGASEELAAIVSLPATENGFLFLATIGGQVKRLRMSDLPGMTSNVFNVINVGDDRLGWAFPTDGQQEIILTTSQGQAIRFKESEIRPTGLAAGGMRGIKMGANDRVIGAHIARADDVIWTITDDGIAKYSLMEEYPTQGRAGGGVITMRLPKTSREVVAAAVGQPSDTIVVLTNRNKPKSVTLGSATLLKRGRAGGDELISTSRKDESIALAVAYQPIFIPLEQPAPEDETFIEEA